MNRIKRMAALGIATMLVLLATSPVHAQAVTTVARAYPTAVASVARDPQDARERFLLLTPGGPLIVECLLTFNEQPFRMDREKIIVELFDRLKKNEKGEVSWEQTLSERRSALNQALPRFGARDDVKRLAKQFDANEDGLVQHAELRRLVANSFGDDFNLSGSLVGRSVGATVTELLDTDGNATLSAKEMAATFERLKSRDQDDNDLLTAAELSGQTPGFYRPVAVVGGGEAAQLAILLGPAANLPAVYDAIATKYRDKDGKLCPACFPLLPQLVDQLDTDRNCQFDRSEAAGLNTISPQLTCEAALSDKPQSQSIEVKIAAPELEAIVKVVARSDNSITLRFPMATLTFAVARPSPVNVMPQQGQVYIDRFDKDKNGYLEASELEGQQGFAAMFDGWDSDGDGKVYAAEINEALVRQVALTQKKFNIMAADQGSPLFSAIDGSGDGQLGLRELFAAAEKLKTFDLNNDGQITGDEVPRPISLTIGRGNMGMPGAYVQSANGFYAGGQSTAPGKTDWFAAMDRNSDGDISRREFLGAGEKFDQLDANRDGLVDRKEAGVGK